MSFYHFSQRAKSQNQKGKAPPSQLPVQFDQGLHTHTFCLFCSCQYSGVHAPKSDKQMPAEKVMNARIVWLGA